MTRLPKALKKKLEASLESLTPKQAGRLFLIYWRDVMRPGNDKEPSLWEYPPVVELFDAWRRRTDAAKQKGDGEAARKAVAYHNGFVLLTDIVEEANNLANSEIWRLMTLVTGQAYQLETLLIRDSLSEIARITIERILEGIPRALTWEEYDRAVAWYEGYKPVKLGELANSLVYEWATRQGYEIDEFFVPDEFLIRYHGGEEEFNGRILDLVKGDKSKYPETEDVRRQWAKETDLLTNRFAGNQERLEAWIANGGCPELNNAEFDAKAEEMYTSLVDMVKAGELEGGLCFSLVEQWEAVPAHDWEETLDLKGKIPAWAALRAIWLNWLNDHDIFKSDDLRYSPKIFDIPDPLETFRDIDGVIQGDRLVEVTKAFYLDCLKKPWGGGLKAAETVDFGALADWLSAYPTPLLAYRAPDLGWVEVEIFAVSEATADPFLGQEQGRPDWYATLRSLRQKAAEMGFKPEDMGYNGVQEFYYPTQEPTDKRMTLWGVTQQLNSLRVSHRPFTYREKGRSLPSLLGLEFYTPLEEAIKNLGTAVDQVETFKMTYALLSQEFFDGIPILGPWIEDHLTQINGLLGESESRLNDWLKKLSSPPWDIDTSSLHLVRHGPNEEQAKLWAGVIISAADGARDNPERPTLLDGDETPESILKRLTGHTYKSLHKTWLSRARGSK